jgi:hypothetical protein
MEATKGKYTEDRQKAELEIVYNNLVKARIEEFNNMVTAIDQVNNVEQPQPQV